MAFAQLIQCVIWKIGPWRALEIHKHKTGKKWQYFWNAAFFLFFSLALIHLLWFTLVFFMNACHVGFCNLDLSFVDI